MKAERLGSVREPGQAREKLAEGEERFRLTRSLGIGPLSWDVALNSAGADENNSALFGLQPAGSLKQSCWGWRAAADRAMEVSPPRAFPIQR